MLFLVASVAFGIVDRRLVDAAHRLHARRTTATRPRRCSRKPTSASRSTRSSRRRPRATVDRPVPELSPWLENEVLDHAGRRSDDGAAHGADPQPGHREPRRRADRAHRRTARADRARRAGGRDATGDVADPGGRHAEDHAVARSAGSSRSRPGSDCIALLLGIVTRPERRDILRGLGEFGLAMTCSMLLFGYLIPVHFFTAIDNGTWTHIVPRLAMRTLPVVLGIGRHLRARPGSR